MSISTELTRAAQNAASVNAAKSAIASAITAKGGTVGASDGLEDFAAAIAGIPSGGGKVYAEHTVEITLLSTTPTLTILNDHIDECADWVIYPADADNTALNTIAAKESFGTPRFSITTPTGVTLNTDIGQYRVNDQTYNSVRLRGSVNYKPAGNYILKFYGIPKEAST